MYSSRTYGQALAIIVCAVLFHGTATAQDASLMQGRSSRQASSSKTTASTSFNDSLRKQWLNRKRTERDHDDPRARAEYLSRHTSGGVRVPENARLNALQQMRLMQESEGRDFRESYAANPEKAIAGLATNPNSWIPIGPTSTQTPFNNFSAPWYEAVTAGRVTALAVDPSDATGQTVYVGAAYGGVWMTSNGGTSWSSLTDSQASLAIGSIAVDPNNPNIIYVGTGEENFAQDNYYGAGILKGTITNRNTNPFTITWTLLGNSSGTPFAGPYCASGSISCNGGAYIGSIAVQPGVASGTPVLLAAIQNPNTSFNGVMRSTDGGTVWTMVAGDTCSANIWANVVAFADNQVAFAGYAGCGVYRSGNAGSTFTNSNGSGGTAISTASSDRVQLTVAPNTPTTIYASLAANTFGQGAGTALGGFYKSTDSGTNWTKLGPVASSTSSRAALGTLTDYCSGQCWYDMVIAVNPVNPNIVFVAGSGASAYYAAPLNLSCNPYNQVNGPVDNYVMATVDGGTTWTTQVGDCRSDNGQTNQFLIHGTNPEIHVDFHAYAWTPDGKTLYMGNDGGVYSTTSTTAALINITNPTTGTNHNTVLWNNINTNLNITQFYPFFALHPTNINIMYAGAQDNGTQMYDGTQAIGSAWNFVSQCGDGAGNVVDAFNPLVVYSNCEFINVYKATDGLLNLNNPFADTEVDTNGMCTLTISSFTCLDDSNVNFIPPMVGDNNPNAANNVYFGSYRVWQTKTSGSSWSAISGDVTTGTGVINNMAVAPSDITTMYTVSTDGRVYQGVNLNATPTWTNITGTTQPTGVLPSGLRQINAVAVMPSNPNSLIIGYAGWNTTNSVGHIFLTSTVNGTSTVWTNITGNLPNTPINDLVIDPDLANTYYAATDVGVLRTTNGGTTWATMNTGLPNIAVQGLKLHRPTRTLRAVTHGRGVWDISVPNITGVNLSKTSLSMASLPKLSQTATFTYTNGTGNTVTINSMLLSGTNASSFSTNNNCGASVASNVTCNINVIFSPQAAGNFTATLTITDSFTGSPRTVSITATSTDITITANRPVRPHLGSSATFIAAGGSDILALNVQVDPSVASQVPQMDSMSFQCSGLPKGTSCRFSPPNLKMEGNTSGTELTISTTSRTMSKRLSKYSKAPNGTPAGKYVIHVTAKWNGNATTVDVPITVQ